MKNERLVRRRRKATLTQEELAGRLGVATITVKRWEAGQRPQPAHIRRLCELFDATQEELGITDAVLSLDVPTALPEDDNGGAPSDLTIISDMVDWLADATRLGADEVYARMRQRLRQGGVAPTARTLPRSVLADGLIHYYGHQRLAMVGLHPYSLEVAGRRLDLSVVMRPDWHECSVALVNPAGPYTEARERCVLVAEPPPQTPFSPALLTAAIDRLAWGAIGMSSGTGAVMVNKPLYRLVSLDLRSDGMDARFGLDWFAHYALSYDLLATEVVETIRRGASLANALPLRDHLLGDAAVLSEMGARLCPGGLGCLLAVARPQSWSHPADFLFAVQRRSARVLNATGSLSVIPRAFHQHLVDPQEEVPIGVTVVRELEEELFGRVDFDEGSGRARLALNPHQPSLLPEPMQWLAGQDAFAATCTGHALNLATGEYWFNCVACISDESFWSLHGGACLPNWEAAEVQTYSTADPDRLRALITDEAWSSESLLALVEGLRWLAVRFPERVRLPDMEVLV